MQIEEANPDPKNKLIISNPSLQVKTESQVGGEGLNLPIAIRKETKECTKLPLYPLASFLSFQHFSPSHKPLIKPKHHFLPYHLIRYIIQWETETSHERRNEGIRENKKWELMKLLEGKKFVGCKWFYPVKYRADASTKRYKLRLVAKAILKPRDWLSRDFCSNGKNE